MRRVERGCQRGLAAGALERIVGMGERHARRADGFRHTYSSTGSAGPLTTSGQKPYGFRHTGGSEGVTAAAASR